jgi:hypothetical protein
MKNKKLVIIVVLLTISLGIMGYFQIFSSNRVVLKNLKSISTGSCYIYLKIKNEENVLTIVCPNNILYYRLRNESKLFSYYLYIYKIGKIIDENRSLEVNDSSFNNLIYYSVDSNLVEKYRHKDILNDTSIIKANSINYRIDWETHKAVIYCLLLREINCCYNSEGGTTNIYK